MTGDRGGGVKGGEGSGMLEGLRRTDSDRVGMNAERKARTEDYMRHNDLSIVRPAMGNGTT